MFWFCCDLRFTVWVGFDVLTCVVLYFLCWLTVGLNLGCLLDLNCFLILFDDCLRLDFGGLPMCFGLWGWVFVAGYLFWMFV